jgi:isocitrate dehydrogenase (NAD+)
MKLVTDPQRFDVVVTTNQFGDILTDIGAGLVGGLGLAPGANIGEDAAIFEAVHGTAPDIAGKGIANPAAIALSACMMLRQLGLKTEGDRIETAIYGVLGKGEVLTRDLGGTASSKEFTDAVIASFK